MCRVLRQLLVLSVVAVFSALPTLANPVPPGRLVSVGSYRLFLECTGPVSGPYHGPTVVLIASLFSDTWKTVQHGVSAFAPVCRYDRMGVGDSDRIVPPEQSIDEIVADLHTLLANAGVKPPYVLVGHSIAGIYARQYETLYPTEVAGFVFVDSADEEQVWRFAKISHALLFEYHDWPDTYKLGLGGWLPPESLSTWHDDVPLIVLEHGMNWPRGTFKGLTEDQYRVLNLTWDQMQHDLASRSRYGVLRIADKSGHFIQSYQPDVVIQAIHDVLDQVRQLRSESSAPPAASSMAVPQSRP